MACQLKRWDLRTGQIRMATRKRVRVNPSKSATRILPRCSFRWLLYRRPIRARRRSNRLYRAKTMQIALNLAEQTAPSSTITTKVQTTTRMETTTLDTATKPTRAQTDSKCISRIRFGQSLRPHSTATISESPLSASSNLPPRTSP